MIPLPPIQHVLFFVSHCFVIVAGFILLFHLGLGSTHLGSLPPPTSLSSVPLFVSSMATPCFSVASTPTTSISGLTQSPQLHLSSSTANPSTVVPSPTPYNSMAQPGLILSPAADPIPQNLVQRIQSGQFVEMRDLLADNIALLNQLSSLQGALSLSLGTVNHTRLREVPSLVSWLYCFNTYVAVRTSDELTRQMLSYSRLIICEALRHGGSGWAEYDRVFRRQMSINPTLCWNTLDPGLQAATIIGQQSSPGTFCALCRECDHQASQCTLAPLQQQLLSRPPTASQSVSRAPGIPRPPRRPESLLNICVNWNRGFCSRIPCTFRHICASCQSQHRARDCPTLPDGSDYKSPTTLGRSVLPRVPNK